MTPETGKVDFYVVERADGSGLTLVPLGKTNIPDEALAEGATVELVLLADNAQLAGAPAVESVEAAATADAQNTARGYWGQ